jgi:hypothetical protein
VAVVAAAPTRPPPPSSASAASSRKTVRDVYSPTLLIFSLYSVISHSINLLLILNFMCCVIFVDVLAVQHMMYGFGDDPNVSLLNNFLFSSIRREQ